MTTRTTTRAARLDQVCADAVGVARGAITEVDPSDIGEHLEAIAEGDRVVTHFFESHLAGYRGWRWAVSIRPSRDITRDRPRPSSQLTSSTAGSSLST